MLRNPLGKASERALGDAMERARAHPLEVLARARPHEAPAPAPVHPPEVLAPVRSRRRSPL